jgi:hypothetical protein
MQMIKLYLKIAHGCYLPHQVECSHSIIGCYKTYTDEETIKISRNEPSFRESQLHDLCST